MEISEFIEATNRLEQYYNKEYSNEQRQIMFEELKEINIERYRKLISAVLKKCKFLPKIADFVDTDMEMPHTHSQEEEKEKIECKKCNSTGYVIYTKVTKNGDKEMKNQYAAICTCGNAKQYKGWEIKDKVHRSNFYIPLIQELGLK